MVQLRLCCPHRLVWPRTQAFQACDRGSNPLGGTGQRTTYRTILVGGETYVFPPVCLLADLEYDLVCLFWISQKQVEGLLEFVHRETVSDH